MVVKRSSLRFILQLSVPNSYRILRVKISLFSPVSILQSKRSNSSRKFFHSKELFLCVFAEYSDKFTKPGEKELSASPHHADSSDCRKKINFYDLFGIMVFDGSPTVLAYPKFIRNPHQTLLI